ncbi:hypothetical protein GCM10007977_080950 [Dactylosporangium sucinum]|uniref:Uncharacterized protein n=1 Tax=Dactylosporangium sucinum TaxID=1424081 RepID=A0A917U8U7_9ACTN|nr:hypothetical protein GCM10007977_080950 [Dactylosporangium sucinum]
MHSPGCARQRRHGRRAAFAALQAGGRGAARGPGLARFGSGVSLMAGAGSPAWRWGTLLSLRQEPTDAAEAMAVAAGTAAGEPARQVEDGLQDQEEGDERPVQRGERPCQPDP